MTRCASSDGNGRTTSSPSVSIPKSHLILSHAILAWLFNYVELAVLVAPGTMITIVSPGFL